MMFVVECYIYQHHMDVQTKTCLNQKRVMGDMGVHQQRNWVMRAHCRVFCLMFLFLCAYCCCGCLIHKKKTKTQKSKKSLNVMQH